MTDTASTTKCDDVKLAESPTAVAAPIPLPPDQLSSMDVESSTIQELALRIASTVPQFTTDWIAKQLCLPIQIVEEVFWQYKQDHLVEILGQEGPFNYRYAITNKGLERAQRLFEFCGYVGPAPVSLQAYSDALTTHEVGSEVQLEDVRNALQPLTITETVIQVAALAASSGRSLFLFGPPGNGKTTLGRLLHKITCAGEIWIPYAVSVGSTVIRIFDAECHHRSEEELPAKYDRRWVRIRRPFIIAGGEMTIAELDLSFSNAHRFYEAPPHVKANGGTFMVDDFGRQRIDPKDLLNRWIIPLEHETDFLTLHTGQKIQMPFKLMLTVATNLEVNDVADPAFLRRMGYRVQLPPPNQEQYERIFRNYAASLSLHVDDQLLGGVYSMYERDNRELRGSEPRELINRCRDICTMHRKPFELTSETLELAWTAFFGANAPV